MPRPFHIMTKPIGPICNLDCAYCYYLSKEELYPEGERFRMTDSALREYIRQIYATHPGPRVEFAWQGGEPTLMGLDFYRQAVALQKELLPAGWSYGNAMQTNGTTLTEEWCRFFRDERFLIGISIDGPAELHDRHRLDKGGHGSHAAAMRGLRLLQQHGVEHNLLCVVSAANAAHPLEVYRFFREAGVTWLQFIPAVEHMGGGVVSERSVGALEYGRFLSAIFDEWVRHDVGRLFVQLFEECLSVWTGRKPSLCIFAETCGGAMVLDHNGDLYACDHFVEPAYKRGNIYLTPLAELVDSPEQALFGRDKQERLSGECLRCDLRFICNGGCPKDRFITSGDGEPGHQYLCQGYRHFFRHVDPYMRRMAELLRRRLSPAAIMGEVRQADAARWAGVGRNDRCPCGSGRKYKACCMGERIAGESCMIAVGSQAGSV